MKRSNKFLVISMLSVSILILEGCKADEEEAQRNAVHAEVTQNMKATLDKNVAAMSAPQPNQSDTSATHQK